MTWEPFSSDLPSVLRDAGEAHDEVYTLWVREKPLLESWSLILHECPEATEDNKSRGWDTYWIGVGPYGELGCYGEVVECELRPSSQPTLPMMPPSDTSELRLVLADQTAANLDLPREVHLTLRLPAEQLEIVKRGLVRILSSGRPSSHPRLMRV